MNNINMPRAQKVINGDSQSAVVGNNRVLRKNLGNLIFSLHNHDIVVNEGNRVVFNPCGYRTPTTSSAMHDAAKLFGLPPLSASFAKGRFTIKMDGVVYLPTPTGVIIIPINK